MDSIESFVLIPEIIMSIITNLDVRWWHVLKFVNKRFNRVLKVALKLLLTKHLTIGTHLPGEILTCFCNIDYLCWLEMSSHINYFLVDNGISYHNFYFYDNSNGLWKCECDVNVILRKFSTTITKFYGSKFTITVPKYNDTITEYKKVILKTELVKKRDDLFLFSNCALNLREGKIVNPKPEEFYLVDSSVIKYGKPSNKISVMLDSYLCDLFPSMGVLDSFLEIFWDGLVNVDNRCITFVINKSPQNHQRYDIFLNILRLIPTVIKCTDVGINTMWKPNIICERDKKYLMLYASYSDNIFIQLDDKLHRARVPIMTEGRPLKKLPEIQNTFVYLGAPSKANEFFVISEKKKRKLASALMWKIVQLFSDWSKRPNTQYHGVIKKLNLSEQNQPITCKAILKSGKRKGNMCGVKARYGAYCGLHNK
jgi:hypothetical protein